MAWNEQWTHDIDGFDLNDQANGYFCDVPEVQNLHPVEHVIVPIAQNYPVWHRSQPQSGKFTFLLHVAPSGDHETDYARVEAMKAVMGPGPHTYTAQVRGMTNTMTTTVYFDSVMVDEYKVGRWTATATAPDPRLV